MTANTPAVAKNAIHPSLTIIGAKTKTKGIAMNTAAACALPASYKGSRVAMMRCAKLAAPTPSASFWSPVEVIATQHTGCPPCAPSDASSDAATAHCHPRSMREARLRPAFPPIVLEHPGESLRPARPSVPQSLSPSVT